MQADSALLNPAGQPSTDGQQEAPGAQAQPDDATSRLVLAIGAEALRKLQGATVMVLGLGGVGSNCVEALARGGIGRLVVVDSDTVQPSNLNRQAIAWQTTLGMRKVDATELLVNNINPTTEVVKLDRFVLPENLASLFFDVGGPVDYIVDAIDTVSAKLAVAVYAEQTGTPLISSMGAANKFRPECLEIADIYKTSMCPLSRVIRKEARKRGIKRLRVIYSREAPRPHLGMPSHAPRTKQERPPLGTVSYMPPIMGQMIAGAVIRDIAGIG